MAWSMRIRFALKAALVHLTLSLFLAIAVAWLVFGVWYPAPLYELTGGRTLFLILIGVDVICGPVLTLVLYDPAKSRFKWRVDLALIVCTQLGALIFGLSQVASARPVFLAFEGDRFRIVQAIDLKDARLEDAPEGLRALSYSGPRLLGTHLAKSGDSDYLSSLQMSIQGLHPAFRPTRWRPFDEQIPQLQRVLQPIQLLREKNPDGRAELDISLVRLGLTDHDVGYVPLVRDEITDWVVLVRRSDGQPQAYLHQDGW